MSPISGGQPPRHCWSPNHNFYNLKFFIFFYYICVWEIEKCEKIVKNVFYSIFRNAIKHLKNNLFSAKYFTWKIYSLKIFSIKPNTTLIRINWKTTKLASPLWSVHFKNHSLLPLLILTSIRGILSFKWYGTFTWYTKLGWYILRVIYIGNFHFLQLSSSNFTPTRQLYIFLSLTQEKKKKKKKKTFLSLSTTQQSKIKN